MIAAISAARAHANSKSSGSRTLRAEVPMTGSLVITVVGAVPIVVLFSSEMLLAPVECAEVGVDESGGIIWSCCVILEGEARG